MTLSQTHTCTIFTCAILSVAFGMVTPSMIVPTCFLAILDLNTLSSCIVTRGGLFHCLVHIHGNYCPFVIDFTWLAFCCLLIRRGVQNRIKKNMHSDRRRDYRIMGIITVNMRTISSFRQWE